MEDYFCTTHGDKLLPNFICPQCKSSKDGQPFSQEHWIKRDAVCDDDKWPNYDQFKNPTRKDEFKQRRVCHNCKTFSYHSMVWCHTCGQKRVWVKSTNEEFLKQYSDYKGGA